MKLIDLKWYRLPQPDEPQRKRVYAVLLAAAVIAALIAIGWSLGIGGFGEWSLFEE